MKRNHKFSLLIAALFVCLCSATTPYTHGQSLNEDALKANYLLRFIDFIRWDEPKGGHSKIGVLDNESLFEKLSLIAEKKSTDTRSFQIVTLDPSAVTEEQLADLDMLYIGRGQQQNWPSLVATSRRHSIITVSSETGFMESGGLIEFMTMQNRLRFALNLLEVDAYQVGVSSKLAQLSVR